MIEQLIGKARTSVDVHLGDSPIEDLLGQILVNPDGEPSHQIIEGTVVDPSDEEDDPALNARMVDADHER